MRVSFPKYDINLHKRGIIQPLCLLRSLNVCVNVYCFRVSVRGEEKQVTILGIMISLAESHSASARIGSMFALVESNRFLYTFVLLSSQLSLVS